MRSVSVRDFKPGAGLPTSPDYPGRTAAPALWADQASSAAARFPAEQSAIPEFVDPSVEDGIILCEAGLSVIPAEFSGNQRAAGLIK